MLVEDAKQSGNTGAVAQINLLLITSVHPTQNLFIWIEQLSAGSLTDRLEFNDAVHCLQVVHLHW